MWFSLCTVVCLVVAIGRFCVFGMLSVALIKLYLSFTLYHLNTYRWICILVSFLAGIMTSISTVLNSEYYLHVESLDLHSQDWLNIYYISSEEDLFIYWQYVLLFWLDGIVESRMWIKTWPKMFVFEICLFISLWCTADGVIEPNCEIQNEDDMQSIAKWRQYPIQHNQLSTWLCSTSSIYFGTGAIQCPLWIIREIKHLTVYYDLQD